MRRLMISSLPVAASLLLFAGFAPASASDFDRGFANDGLVRDQFRSQSGDPLPAIAPAVSVDRSERVTVSGAVTATAKNSPSQIGDLAVARYTATGKRDLSFDGDGVAVIDLPEGDTSRTTAVVAQNDGSVIVAGEGFPAGGAPGQQAIYVAKLTPSGELDSSFGNGGLTMILVGDRDILGDLAVDADGRILVSGYASDADRDFRADGLVVRLTPEGSFDPAFSGSGVFVLNRYGEQKFDDVDVVGGDQVLLAGQRWSTRKQNKSLILVRLRANGKRKKRFANRGIKIDRSRSFPGAAYATTVGRRRIVAGFGGKQIFMRAFDKRGRRERKFGKRGRVHQKARHHVLAVGLDARKRRIYFQAASDPDIEIAGIERFLVSRFKRNGRRDRAYSRNGKALEAPPRPAGNQHFVTAAALDDVGRVVLTGSEIQVNKFGQWTYAGYTVARFRAW